MVNKCKICENIVSLSPVDFNNMPRVAQNLPSGDELSEDNGMTLALSICPYCGVAFLTVEPVNYYREVIRAVGVSYELKAAKNEQFSNFCQKYDLVDKKIIEIGCGNGEFLAILNKIAPLAYGLEYSDKAVTYGRNMGLNVIKGFIDDENYYLPDGSVDGFLILMFLEHIPEPRRFLRGIYNNLNDGAVGLIEVPNADKIFQEGLYAEIMRDHLFYYNKNSLCTLLEISGFDVIEVNSLRDDYVVSITVRKRPIADLSVISKYLNKIKGEFQTVLKEYDNVSIWGASHQTFFVLSQIGDVGKIRCIIDSAAFKQGKYSPVTHIPIVPPKSGITPDAVIVSGGSYSAEIVGLLKGEYRYSGDIYVFSNDKLVKEEKINYVDQKGK